MGFSERLESAKKFEDEVIAYCERQPRIVSIVKNGTEHTHPGFVALLRSNDEKQSKLIRFAPDCAVLFRGGNVFHVEAKNGNHMEKDAYETYIAYHSIGCRIVVFVKRSDGVVFRRGIEHIKFIPSSDVVDRFPKEWRHPIDDDGWICPRLGHGYAGNGSGTPYKEIDFSSMIEVVDWNIERLESYF